MIFLTAPIDLTMQAHCIWFPLLCCIYTRLKEYNEKIVIVQDIEDFNFVAVNLLFNNLISE